MKGRGISLHVKILIGLVLGALFGIAAQTIIASGNPALPPEINQAWLKDFLVKQVTQPIGGVFLSLIFMVVVPLLFSALVLGVSEIGDGNKLGRIGLRSFGLTLLLSSIAVLVGLVAVNLARPGDGISATDRDHLIATYADTKKADEFVTKSKEAKSVLETIGEVVPRNPLDSAVKALDGGLLALMFFALIFGIALSSIEAEKALPVKQFLEGLLAVSMKIIEYAMRFAPIGVFFLVFGTTAILGWNALAALGKYAILVLLALAFQLVVVYSIALKVFAKRSPADFFRRVKGVMMTAFVTSSSNATLPYALKSAEEDLSLPREISGFVLTVGATANQNGTALFEGITVIFLAQVFGIPLDFGQQLTVMGLSIVAGIGTAGVPGGSWPYIAIILATIGVPPAAIGLCIGVDRILDMSRTVLNVVGDMTIATCVASMEGTLIEIPAEAAG